jgi:hypothetical protein
MKMNGQPRIKCLGFLGRLKVSLDRQKNNTRCTAFTFFPPLEADFADASLMLIILAAFALDCVKSKLISI